CGGERTWTCQDSSGGFGGVVGGRFVRLGRLLAFAAVVVTATTLATLGLVALLVLVLHDQRLLGLGLVAADHQVAKHGVVEAEAFDEFVEHGLVGFDVEQHVVRLDQVVDRIGELAAAPVLETVDLAIAALDQRLVALDHGRHLLALVRMDQEHDFVMTHVFFLVDIRPSPGWGRGPDSPPTPGRARWSKGLPANGSRKLSQFKDLRATATGCRRPGSRAIRCEPVAGAAEAATGRPTPPDRGFRRSYSAPPPDQDLATDQAALSVSVVKLSPQPHSAAT